MELNTRPEGELYLQLLERCLTASIYDESGWRPIVRVEMEGKVVTLPPGVMMVQQTPFQADAREEGRDWPLFAYTMVGAQRLRNVRRCVEHVLAHDIPGDLLEAGVWRGGCAMYMKALLNIHGAGDRTIWLADSFEGMPKPGPVDQMITSQKDLSEEVYLKVSVESVQANFRRFGLLDERVRFIKGWFNQTLASAPVQKIAVLRLDGDLYHSTRDSLEALYDKVSAGGFVIVDDYYAWEGCRRAVDEFRAERKIAVPIEQIDWTGAFWQTPPAAQAR